MRVALVTNTLGLGGAERALCTLAQELAERGHAVEVWLLADSLGIEHELSPLVRRCAVSRGGAVFRPLSVRALLTSVRRFEPDSIVTIVNPVAALLLSAMLPRRVFYWVQNTVRPRSVRVIERAASSAGVRIVTLNSAVTATIRPGAVVAEIPNPVATSGRTVHPEPPSWRSGELLNVGRCVEQKDQAFLLLVMSDLLQMDLGIAPRLTIVGGGPLLAGLRTRSRQLGLDSSVIFTGERQAAAFYRDRPLFLLTSRWEGQGLVLAEAVNSGCPVVARDVEGVREAMGPDYLGLVKTDDPRMFASVVARCITDAGMAQNLLRSASATLSDRFDVRTVASQWEQLLCS